MKATVRSYLFEARGQAKPTFHTVQLPLQNT
jgi:hypothetical protein